MESSKPPQLNSLPAELKPGLQPLLKAIDELSANIAKCNLELEQRIDSYPEAKQLREVPGVGTLTALNFVLTLGDKNRFIHSRDVGFAQVAGAVRTPCAGTLRDMSRLPTATHRCSAWPLIRCTTTKHLWAPICAA